MRWAVITHPDQIDVDGELLQTPTPIAESSLPVALSQGWFVLAKDSDVQPVPIHGLGARDDDDA